MSPTLEVALWWVAFGGSHLLLSSLPVRNRLVALLGERVFQGLYSLVVLGLFIPLVLAYFAHKHTGTVLWSFPPGPLVRWTMYVGIAAAFVLIVCSQVTPSPANLVPGEARPRGVLRITRHPFIMGTALWALLHLLPNGTATDVAFFGGFVIFSLVGAWHQDARKLATNVPGYRAFCAATPFLPFTGADTLRGLRELAPAALAIGIAATVVVRYFHAAWFGG
jgi:uncharacterized membrane protein